MKIRFEPLTGQDHVEMPDLSTSFAAGEERELPDAKAELALSNPNFVDAATGKNPNFTCEHCEQPHLETVMTPDGLVNATAHAACAAAAAASATPAPEPSADARVAVPPPTERAATATSAADAHGAQDEPALVDHLS